MKYMENMFFQICQNIHLREEAELPRRELSYVSWRGNRQSFILVLYMYIHHFVSVPDSSKPQLIEVKASKGKVPGLWGNKSNKILPA